MPMTLPNLLAFTQEDARRLPTSLLLRLMDGHTVREVLYQQDNELLRDNDRLRSTIQHVQTLAMDEIDRRIPVPDDPRPTWAIEADPRR